MAESKRLVDLYRPGDPVWIHFAGDAPDCWRPGQVLAGDHPGLWVAVDGHNWFVTNGRRIRRREEGEE